MQKNNPAGFAANPGFNMPQPTPTPSPTPSTSTTASNSAPKKAETSSTKSASYGSVDEPLIEEIEDIGFSSSAFRQEE